MSRRNCLSKKICTLLKVAPSRLMAMMAKRPQTCPRGQMGPRDHTWDSPPRASAEYMASPILSPLAMSRNSTTTTMCQCIHRAKAP